MSAIAGLFRPTLHASPAEAARDRETCFAMLAALAHRGAGRGGYAQDEHLVLAHRHGPSTAAKPPLPVTNDAGSLWLACDGALDHDVALRRALARRGHQLRGDEPAEVALHLFAEEREEAFRRLRGGFAIALWDRAARTLYLARDPLGRKPLFFRWVDEALLFASEIKALSAGGRYPLRLDPAGIGDTLAFGWTIAPRTCFREVAAVRPGHLVVFSGRGAREVELWDGDACLPEVPRGEPSLRAAVDAVEGALLHSAERTFTRHPDACLTLSGGLASTLLAAGCVRGGARPTSFAIALDAAGSEAAAPGATHPAEPVAKALRLELRRIAVQGDRGALLRDAVLALEQPIASLSPVSAAALMRGVGAAGIAAAVSGLGARALFAGHPLLKLAKLRSLAGPLPRVALRRLAGSLLERYRLPADARSFAVDAIVQRGDGVARRLGFLPAGYEVWRLTAAWRDRVFQAGFLARLRERTIEDALRPLRLERTRGRDDVARSLHLELRTRLPFELGAADRAAAAGGVELELPFLDAEMVDVVLDLPSSLKLRRLTDRFVLRHVARRLAPRSLARRRERERSWRLRDFLVDADRPEPHKESSASRAAGRTAAERSGVGRSSIERSGVEWTGNTLGALLAADEIEAAGVLNPRFVHKLCERVAAERGETFLAVQHERLLLWCVSLQLLYAQLVRGEHAPRAATAASDLQLVTRSPWPDAPGSDALPPLARARSA